MDSSKVEDDKSLPYPSEKVGAGSGSSQDAVDFEHGQTNALARNLQGRHMQMIAIAFMIIGGMLLCTMQALGELAVLYPVNGAFYQYSVRFIDEAWGFAMGWDYVINWLVVLPFEITAAGITIEFWRDDINIAVWIVVFLFLLTVVQVFGVRGYGEVELVLGLIKITAVVGFIILGIIIDCGGVPSDNRGYIGAHYWHDPGAFRNGFKGFCTVFVTAAFAFAGTELCGLAAAEAADPRKSLPKATRQVFWRITLFYVLSLFIVGLIVRSDNENLLGTSGADTKASPFVLAIQLAGIKGLPSVFNVVITMAVLSVANSCAYGSTRTMQALSAQGMGPKFLRYIDSKGRPVWCIVIQLLFGLLAFIGESGRSGEVFTWLLSLAGLSNFFVWGSINLAHIRFRSGWKAHGRSLDELPYRAAFGVIGSYIGLSLNWIALIATFYTSVFPIGSDPDAEAFFKSFLAAPIVLFLYLCWKVGTLGRGGLFVRSHQMDIQSGLRCLELGELPDKRQNPLTWPVKFVKELFV
ncbi:MAG: hypothetical protein LQ351_005486 [Letrouitia transgressa]|nr:MAG: hypothetical protein LQ351_005486 [Letrouitia transgressa]